ncbi:MAG: hypothetical protein IT455_18800 [Planctomycetes bacterium]|nr:hypothetical protein [Planctomycetota bacterium]
MTRPDPSPAAPPPAPWLPALALGGAAAIAYALLQGERRHEFDLYWILPRLAAGELDLPRHPLALPCIEALTRVMPGGSLLERWQLACALATAAAVTMYTLAAFAVRRDRRQALVVGAVTAVLPATVHFATCAEMHGVFQPFAAAALWQLGRIAGEPAAGWRWPSAAGLGLLTGLATSVHATGALLVPLAVVWLVSVAWRASWRRAGLAVFALVVAHAAVVGAVGWLVLPAGEPAAAAAQWQWLLSQGGGLGALPAMVAGEWLWPFLPVSVLWLLALGGRERRLAVGFAGVLAAYLGVSQLLLVFPGIGYEFHESGAYLLPLGCVAAGLAVATLPAALRPWLVVLAALVTVVDLVLAPATPIRREFGRVAAARLRAGERLLVADDGQFDGAFDAVFAAAALRARLGELLGVPQFVLEVRQRVGLGVDAGALALWFHPQVAGRATVVTDAALAELRAFGGVFAELVDRALPALFAFVRVDEGPPGPDGLHGVRLQPR